MEPMFKKIISLLLILLLLLPAASAMAELKRGSRGQEVKTLQEMLIELGFLNDKADGIFGKKTEAAVKALQKYWGVNTTGRLDDDDLMALYDLYFLATGVMEGDGLDEEELREIYPAYCSWEGKDEWGGVYCFRHQEECQVSGQLMPENAPKKLEELLTGRVCALWERDIFAMYEEWEDSLPEEDRHIAREQRALFETALKEYKPGLEKMLWIEAQGIDLCFDLHGAEAQPLEEEASGA